MRERPLVYLVPPMAAALYAAVCLELPVQLGIAAPIALLLVLAAVFLRRYKCLLTVFAVLAAAALALTGFAVFRDLRVVPIRALAGETQEITAAALRDAGLMSRAQRISVAKFNMESGYEQARQLFERAGEINALFCATDTIAIGAIQYCRSQGLRVPEDVMVASVGDSRAGRVAYVPLTSAHLHYRTAGDKAARLLLDQLADPHARPRELELGWELKCRASTGDENADENIWAL